MNALTSALLDAANLAPSAHNTQPWRLRFGASELAVFADLARALPAADPDHRDLVHALGALVENCLLTLGHHGFAAEVTCAERLEAGRAVVTLRWLPEPGRRFESELYRMIPLRRTSRRAYAPAPIPPVVLARLQAIAAAPFRLRVLAVPGEIDALRRIAAAADLALMEQPAICLELRRWLRFSPADPAWYRDGLNAECMGWSRLEALVAKRLIDPAAVRVVRKMGLARPLLGGIDHQAPRAPAICLLTGPVNPSLAGRIEGGRTLQRIWLAAAAAGLCTHPLSAAIDHGPARLQALSLFGAGPEGAPINLFRLGVSPPVPGSHRLPADELLAEE